MKQHNENYFVIPAIMVIASCPGGCTTQHVKENIHKFCAPNEKDNMPFPSRGKKEPRYYQVVGNMISHKNKQLFMYINVREATDEKGNPLHFNILSLNEAGKKLLEDCQDEMEEKTTCFVSITDPYNAKLINRILTCEQALSKRSPTNSKIAEEILEINEYRCEYACCIEEEHKTFVTVLNRPFMYVHHLVPMKAAKDFAPISLDRPSNLVPLCPICHAILHHGALKEKLPILKILYDKHIAQLNADGIYISFEDLVEKYYKPCSDACEKEMFASKDADEECDEEGVNIDNIVEAVNCLGGHGTCQDILDALKVVKGTPVFTFDKERVFSTISANTDIFIRTCANGFDGYRVSVSRLLEVNQPARRKFIDKNIAALNREASLVFNVINAIQCDVFEFNDVLAYKPVVKKMRCDVEDVEKYLEDELNGLVLSGLLEKLTDSSFKKAYRFA